MDKLFKVERVCTATSPGKDHKATARGVIDGSLDCPNVNNRVFVQIDMTELTSRARADAIALANMWTNSNPCHACGKSLEERGHQGLFTGLRLTEVRKIPRCPGTNIITSSTATPNFRKIN